MEDMLHAPDAQFCPPLFAFPDADVAAWQPKGSPASAMRPFTASYQSLELAGFACLLHPVVYITLASPWELGCSMIVVQVHVFPLAFRHTAWL